MKMKLQYRLLSFLLVASMLVFWGCGSDSAKTAPEKTALKKLSKTWSIKTTGGASLDGTDRTSDFTNFKLTISGSFDSGNPEGPYAFSVQGSRPDPSPWPGADLGSDGTWTFASVADKTGTSGQIIREEDGVGITYSINSAGELSLLFTCSTCDYAGNRVSQVNGNWTFVLN